MDVIPLAVEAQMHRETYSAIINHALSGPGTKTSFARAADISPQHLSYILAPDIDDGPESLRRAGHAVIERIVRVFPAPPEVREQLRVHMTGARMEASLLKRNITDLIAVGELNALLQSARSARDLATFASDPIAAQTYYVAALQLARTTLSRTNIALHPIETIELCLIIHDTECVLNRSDVALWHGLLAHHLAQSIEYEVPRERRAEYNHLAVNALRSVAVAYGNMQMARNSLVYCRKAAAMPIAQQDSVRWAPHINRDCMKALIHIPRSSIGEIEALAIAAGRACASSNDESAGLLELLVEEQLARAYLRNKRPRPARQLLQPHMSTFAQLPRTGPLHHVLLLRSYSKVCLALGDLEQGLVVQGQALALAQSAGLRHQAWQIERDRAQQP